jgi:DNA-binding NtrC family response regulator
VVDDDADVQQAARLFLGRHRFSVSTAAQPAQIWTVLAGAPVDVIVLDLNFSRGAVSGAEGFACLAEIMAHDPHAVVVVVTGHSGINIAVQAMRAGAADFIMKPWNNARLLATLDAALDLRRRRVNGAGVIADIGGPDDDILLGESAAMERVRELIRRAAPTQASVLILGEAGTGKSLVARTLHRQSSRAAGPFVRLDLPALTDEDALEGLADARGGTLVLDEVCALSPPLQSRLLTLLDAGHIQARLVATTRRPRSELGLREDLLVRLNTVEIALPPLHTRGDDAAGLAEHFLRAFAHRHGRPQKPLSPEALDVIVKTRWPGDVRGLRQAMERCVIFADGDRYEPDDIHGALASRDLSPPEPSASLTETERALVTAALKRASFNVSHAAKALGLTRAAPLSAHGQIWALIGPPRRPGRDRWGPPRFRPWCSCAAPSRFWLCRAACTPVAWSAPWRGFGWRLGPARGPRRPAGALACVRRSPARPARRICSPICWTRRPPRF